MEFGPKFIKAIETIYSEQEAKVMINGDFTAKFKIQKGTRQGCPLSPLLFILTLEILARIIRKNDNIKGLQVKKEIYKLQAFADDLVFILEDPIESSNYLLEILELYGQVSGFKINKDKTKMIVKNMKENQRQTLSEKINIQITKSIKYLGIILTARSSTLKKDNYDPLIEEIKNDLNNWTKLQLSFIGRISAVKMNTLPKLLFLFQTIPVRLKQDFFTNLNKIIGNFIWQHKKPRIKLKFLQENKDKGGCGLPDWKEYYYAASLSWIKEWVKLENTRILELEGHDLQSGWHSFLCDQKHRSHRYFMDHIIRKSLLEVWLKIKKQFYRGVPIWFSPLEAFVYPNLKKSGKNITYKELIDEEGNLKTRSDLSEAGLNFEWWEYLQIKSRAEKDKRELGIEPPSILDKLLTRPNEKSIKLFYHFLLDYKMETEIVKDSMIKWAQDFRYNIYLDEWEQLWKRNSKLTLATSYKENWLKMFYRWHITPTHLAKINKKPTPKCWKCGLNYGSYYHMWWQCAKAKLFWDKIQTWIEEIFEMKIVKRPEFFLLGILREKWDKKQTYLSLHIITAARLIFAQFWKNENIPSDIDIIEKITVCAEMDQLTKQLRNKEDTEYYESWGRFYNWLEIRNKKSTKN